MEPISSTISPVLKNIIISTATASYQIEGGWNEDGKGENIWDRLLHTIDPSFTVDHSNGDTACDSYHKIEEDISMLRHVGFDMYRFSISWTRIMPDGECNFINKKGVEFYMKLIDGLIANNIQPMVTLYHWDLPQKLQDMGGWTNPLIVDYFKEYARVIFDLFGDKVKWWITINDPLEITHGYDNKAHAPNLGLNGTGNYLAAHNLIKAHAAAYRLYEKEFKDKQKGKISFSLNGGFSISKSNSAEDIEATDRRNQFTIGWFAHPVYSENGDYPPIMRKIIDENSKTEGRPWSRLPSFTNEEIQFIKGSYDFLAVNHYTSVLIEAGDAGATPSWEKDTRTITSVDPSWPSATSSWLKVVPEGFRGMLNWLKKEYRNTAIFITENGFSDSSGTEDQARIDYFQNYINAMEKAIAEDGCNIIGYTIWSLMDNFEWKMGYTEKFGIYEVDFSDPCKSRKPKQSAKEIKKMMDQIKCWRSKKLPGNTNQ